MGDSTALRGRAAAQHRAERRPVSVLFTDMVGYTAIVSKLGEETSVNFTRMIYAMLSDIVEKHGGAVRGFAGDSIMAVFGIPEALEDSALRACATALAIHRAFADAADDITARFGVRVIMRVGISSGSVVVAAVEGEDAQMTAVGSTVNLASRIQSLAPEGGCLICGNTRALVQWLVDMSFDGEHQIKGIAKPHKLWRLLSVHEGATRFDASLGRGLSQHVGRGAELAALTEALASTRDGLRVADLVAEPGLGKTRLVFEFLRSAALQNVRVYSGHCTAVGQRVPLFPFVGVVRAAFRIEGGEEAEQVEQKLREGLERTGLNQSENLGLLMNLLGHAPPEGTLDGLDGVLVGLRSRDLLVALLAGQCAAGPVVLLVEDIHWIDGVSQELLQRLIGSGDLKNLLILTNRRPEYLPPWRDDPSTRTIELRPLSDDDIHDLIRARLKIDALPDEMLRQVTERAGGNPLFCEELLSFLLEQGLLKIGGGKVWYDAEQGENAVPASMQGLLSARIDQLQPEDRELLQAAATIGRQFDPGLLSQVSPHLGDTGAALQRLKALDIIYPEGATSDYVFKHVLLRDTVYQSLLAESRSKLHLDIAKALELRNANNLPEAAETLAHHYSQTDRADLAFKYNALAGVKSLGVFSLDQANHYFDAALALYEREAGCASDGAFAEFLGNYALCLNISLDVMTMISVAPRVRPVLLRIGDNGDHVLFLHHYVSCLVGNSRFIEAQEVQQELTEMAKRLGDPKSIAYAMVNELSVSIYRSALSNAEFEAKRTEVETALAKFNDAYLQNFYLATIGWNELTRGRVVRARETAERMVELGERTNDPRALGYGTAMKALVAVVTDDQQKALEFSDEACRLSRVEFEIAIAESSRVAALIALEKPGALALAQDYVRMREADGCTLFAGVPQSMVGVGLAMEGRVSEGLSQIENTIRNRETEGALIAADWNRLLLSEVYLQILTGEGGASLQLLFRNFRALMGVMLSGEKRIRSLIAKVRQNPQFDEDGHYFARGEMILGLLCKLKKRKAQAREHLATAQRLIAPTGASPMLSRIEMALQELAD
ncbi:ATP-binding protein [Albibacillus kandeliae]|uniref:ATP-binding protein n=1 Tax=Albibacillus kandeliae TaxID=2174228 RepID=UPI000D6894D5|nr:adenylate/guanylate cyclase domain-containing protein [Albibacillus kandeliae]